MTSIQPKGSKVLSLSCIAMALVAREGVENSGCKSPIFLSNLAGTSRHYKFEA